MPITPLWVSCHVIALVGLEEVEKLVFAKLQSRNQQIQVDIESQVFKKSLVFMSSEY